MCFATTERRDRRGRRGCRPWRRFRQSDAEHVAERAQRAAQLRGGFKQRRCLGMRQQGLQVRGSGGGLRNQHHQPRAAVRQGARLGGAALCGRWARRLAGGVAAQLPGAEPRQQRFRQCPDAADAGPDEHDQRRGQMPGEAMAGDEGAQGFCQCGDVVGGEGGGHVRFNNM